jgi:hypothetical protein
MLLSDSLCIREAGAVLSQPAAEVGWPSIQVALTSFPPLTSAINPGSSLSSFPVIGINFEVFMNAVVEIVVLYL